MQTEATVLKDLLHAVAQDKSKGFLAELEAEIEDHFSGQVYGLALNSCSAAMQLCLSSFGIQPGELVLMADLQDSQVINPVIHIGATPVLLDVQKDSLALDPERLQSWIGSRGIRRRGAWFDRESGCRISAVIVSSREGLSAPMKEYQQICQRYELLLIESAAALSNPHTDKSTMISDATILDTSRHPFQLGAGAVLIFKEKLVRDTSRSWAELCQLEPNQEPRDYGFQYRMPELLAGLAVHQLRQNSANFRSSAIKEISATEIESQDQEGPLILRIPRGESEESFGAQLFERGWIARKLPVPLSANKIYARFSQDSNTDAENACRELLLVQKSSAAGASKQKLPVESKLSISGSLRS